MALVESLQASHQEGQVGSRLLNILCALHSKEAVDHLSVGGSRGGAPSRAPPPVRSVAQAAALQLESCSRKWPSVPPLRRSPHRLRSTVWAWTSSLGLPAGSLGPVSCGTHMKSPRAACAACGSRAAHAAPGAARASA